VGAWFLRPRLVLTASGPPHAGPGGVGLELALANPTALPVAVARPDDVRAALWLAVTGPDGAVHDLPFPGADELFARAGGEPAGADLTLAPGTARRVVRTFQEPFALPGVYRLRAMYRPEGQAALVSEPLPLEVR
jgi:hypothetical protein